MTDTGARLLGSLAASTAPRHARVAAMLVLVAGTLAIYWPSIAAYARDNHYQSHFVFLWVFFGAAMYRAGRGHFDLRVQVGDARGVFGIVGLLFATALLHVALVSGSTTAQRLSLVALFGAVLVLAMRQWSVVRCASWAAFALLCFGIPYSAYSAATQLFRASFLGLLAILPRYTWLDYTLRGSTLVYPGPPPMELSITPDCSGFNQLVTFLGLAFLGALTGRPTVRRTVLLFVLGIVLAYATNVVRVLLFVVLFDAGHTEFVLDPFLHGLAGTLPYLPFVIAFMWVALRTHRPLALPPPAPGRLGRRVPLLLALVPLAALRAWHGPEPLATGPAPAYVAALEGPPGYVRLERADLVEQEACERNAYDTPWLTHAFWVHEARPERWLHVFAYVTRSRSQLSVHQIANCLRTSAENVRYGGPVVVAGRTFWSFEFEAQDGPRHGYYSFAVGGEDLDDSLGTQLAVFWTRITSGVSEVGLTRFIVPGPLPPQPDARDLEILTWRARQLASMSGH